MGPSRAAAATRTEPQNSAAGISRQAAVTTAAPPHSDNSRHARREVLGLLLANAHTKAAFVTTSAIRTDRTSWLSGTKGNPLTPAALKYAAQQNGHLGTSARSTLAVTAVAPPSCRLGPARDARVVATPAFSAGAGRNSETASSRTSPTVEGGVSAMFTVAVEPTCALAFH